MHTSQRLSLTRSWQSCISWVEQLIEVRPTLPARQARFLVHAAMALVVDVGRLVHYDDSAQSRSCVRALMELTLFGS
jgi:hypothetical protein